ncbi:MAG: hypothetical protein SGI74_04805 [Oligoflexia bacterium]|nr:hypothetical protein [Oligoflexia bacterium]
MNLERLFIWITGVVIAFASIGQLDVLQNWIWKAQAHVIYESRSSNWGSPRFFSDVEVSNKHAVREK